MEKRGRNENNIRPTPVFPRRILINQACFCGNDGVKLDWLLAEKFEKTMEAV
jgi:hypothetical protein